MHTQLNLKIGLLLHFWPSSVMYMLQKWYFFLSKLFDQILMLNRNEFENLDIENENLCHVSTPIYGVITLIAKKCNK